MTETPSFSEEMKMGLASSDRPRTLTADERLRLRHSLDSTPAQTRTSIGRPALWVTLAAAIGVIAGFGLINQPQAEDVVTLDAPTTTSPPCRDLSPELADGIEDWGSVEDWSIAPNPSPDLASLTSEAITRLPPTPDGVEVLQTLEELIDQGESVLPADADQRAESLRSALSYVNEAIGAGSDYCPSRTIEDAATFSS